MREESSINIVHNFTEGQAMKKFSVNTILLIMLCMASTVGMAQQASVVYDSHYDNSDIDTTLIGTSLVLLTSHGPENIGSYSNISLAIDAPDSMNVKIYLDTKSNRQTTWTLRDSVTVNSLTVPHTEWVLRSQTVDITGGFLGLDIRLRRVYAGSGNTLVSTQKATNTLLYTK